MRVLIAMLALTTTAYADTELSIGSTDRALRSSSADAVTGDSYTGGQLGVAHELHLGLDNISLSATGSLQWGGASGTLLDLATELSQSAYLVGGRARCSILRHLDATAQLQVGLAHTSLSLTDAMSREISDTAWGGIAEGTVGIELLAVQQRSFTLGLRLELGYVASTPTALAAKSQHPDDGTLRLQMTQASLGRLDLSGPVAGLAAVSRF